MSQFYRTYLASLGDVDLMDALSNGKDDFLKLVAELPEYKWHYAYRADKWNVMEVMLHIIDTERIFQYRAFRFSRNDKTELPGFEQEDYIREAKIRLRTKGEIIDEYKAVRDATIALFKGMTDKELGRRGLASGKVWSVGGLGFVISGHQKHHCNIILSRYL